MSFRSSDSDVSWIVLAKSISWFGDLLAEVALVLRLQSHGTGPSAISALLIANALPIMLLSGVVGRAVDRFDNRRLLVRSSLVQAGLCLAVAFVGATPAVLGIVALIGGAQAVNAACWQSMLATIAEGETLPRAIGRAQAGTTAAGIVAPAAGGLLVGAYGARVPLLLDALAYLGVAGVALLIVARRVVGAAPAGQRRQGGFTIVRDDGLLRALFVLLGLFVLIGSMINVVEVFLIRETLHASTTWYGVAGATLSAGALAGALLAGRLRGIRPLARGFVASAVLLALSVVAAGLAPTIGWLLPAVALLGFMNGVLNVALSSLVMVRARPDERGRVSALLTGVASGTQLVAFAAGGALAEAFSPRQIFVAAGAFGALVPVALGRGLLRRAAVAAAARVAPVQAVAAAAG